MVCQFNHLLESTHAANLIAAHVTLCRSRNQHLRNALAVIIPEANLPFASVDICQALQYQIQLDNHTFVMEDRSQAMWRRSTTP